VEGQRSLLRDGLGIGFPGGEKIALCIILFVYSLINIIVILSLHLLSYKTVFIPAHVLPFPSDSLPHPVVVGGRSEKVAMWSLVSGCG